MATCPACGVSSRTDPGAFTLTLDAALVANPPAAASLAGVQLKTTAQTRHRLTCNRCGWHVLGDVDGQHFVADWPTTSAKPQKED